MAAVVLDPIPPKGKLWTPERTRGLRRLVEQCGPNLCTTIMAIELGVRGNMRAQIVGKKLRELGIERTPL